MLVVLIVSERREISASLIMLTTKQGSHWFHSFGIARSGFETATPAPKRTLYQLNLLSGPEFTYTSQYRFTVPHKISERYYIVVIVSFIKKNIICFH